MIHDIPYAISVQPATHYFSVSLIGCSGRSRATDAAAGGPLPTARRRGVSVRIPAAAGIPDITAVAGPALRPMPGRQPVNDGPAAGHRWRSTVARRRVQVRVAGNLR
jgi:hypothetical protein